jgi:hypothetical protein
MENRSDKMLIIGAALRLGRGEGFKGFYFF